MELTADIINRWFKLGVSATDMTYGQLSIGASLTPLNNMGTDVQQPFDTPEGIMRWH